MDGICSKLKNNYLLIKYYRSIFYIPYYIFHLSVTPTPIYKLTSNRLLQKVTEKEHGIHGISKIPPSGGHQLAVIFLFKNNIGLLNFIYGKTNKEEGDVLFD